MADTAEDLYRRALECLSPEEREQERSRAIPYAFSLNALARFFFEAGRRQGWLCARPEDVRGPVIVAVSGGGDSTALLWLFRVFFHEGRVIAAHLEHGIRGEESLADAAFVAETARLWGVEAEIHRTGVPGLLKKGESLETGARRLRYEFLETTAKKHGALGVALGHNKEDVAETVLFNLLRGSGARGAVGIPERRGIFFRPLLRCSRAFLRGLLHCRGLQWREDRTNTEGACARNFIRNELIPLAEKKINAKATAHLAAFADEMRGWRAEEEARGAALLEAVGVNGGEWRLDRGKARGFSLWERTLLAREIGRRLGLPTLPRGRCLELARLMEGKEAFEFQWNAVVSILGDRETLVFTRGENDND
ncbi:MAG: tRNA lysidine(34) synthetase TilS [Synergistaceae bacterium]|nr:tRNA lysidine(34) synthetase TilS [Synergistaceae bacterium]